MKRMKYVPILFLCLLSIGQAQQDVPFSLSITTNGSGSIDEPDFSLTGGLGEFSSVAPPIINHYLERDADFTLSAHDDRTAKQTSVYKHHNYNDDVDNHHLLYEFTTPSNTTPVDIEAEFKSGYTTAVFNNFEEYSDEGYLDFNDPWYVDENGDQLEEYVEYPSILQPTGNYSYDDPSDAIVFGYQGVTAGNPYYSVKYKPLLEGDYETEVYVVKNYGTHLLLS